jgi:hypothetical protein
MIFPSFTARRALTLLYFPIVKSAPTTILVGSLSLLSGDRTSRLRGSNGRAFGSQIPETRYKSTLTLSLSYRNFSYRDFDTHDVESLVLPTLEPRYAETPMRSRVEFSTVPSLHRYFGVRNIANPNAIFSALHPAKF